MKLRPTQIVGLIAVVIFGGILIRTLAQPKPDPFKLPGAVPLAEAPASLATDTLPTVEPVVPVDLLALGSQDARDDLYCSGLIFAVHRTNGELMSSQADANRDQVIKLAEAGVAKLIAEGVATSDQTGKIADAHTDKADADFDAGSPRIAIDDCRKRADALPAK